MAQEVDKNRAKIIGTLGELLSQAARASVARGAAYEPQEKVTLDAAGAWAAVAETIMKLVEAKVREEREEKDKQDDG